MTENESSKEDATDKTADKCGQHQNEAVTPANRNSVGKLGFAFFAEIVGLGCATTGLWVLGERLEGHGYAIPGGLANYLACVAFFSAGAISALKFWPRPKIVWPMFGVVCIILAAIWVVSGSGHKPPKPHLALILNTSDSPRVDLMFTNEFLFWEYPKLKREAPFLIIPVPVGRTNVALTFKVWNDSASPFSTSPDPILTADGVELRLLMYGSRPDGRLKWHPDKEWRCDDVSETNAGMKQLTRHFPSIIPGASELAPEIRFDISEDFSEPMLVRASIRSRTVPINLTIFQLAFLRSDNPLNPRFETNSIIAGHIHVLPKKQGTNSN